MAPFVRVARAPVRETVHIYGDLAIHSTGPSISSMDAFEVGALVFCI